MLEIIMLHHVASNASSHVGPRAQYVVTPNQLAECIRHRRTWQSLAGENIQQYNGSERSFLLTFDDGYRNNLTEAVPVLERFNVHAIIFITTGFIDREVYPYELELASAIRYHDTLHVSSDVPPIEVHTRGAEESLYQRLRQPLKTKSHAERETFMEELAELNRYDRHFFQDEQLLSWEDIVELDRHPLITIGAHTETHPVLTRQFPWVAYREMKASKRKLEKVLRHDVFHFSYPYGRNNAAVRMLARWSGFRWAFTTEGRRINDFGACNPMALPRIDIRHLV